MSRFKPSFKEFLELFEELQLVVTLPESMISRQALLNEGQWIPSGEKDWMLRVDPVVPAMKIQRHVHIARAKHTSAKNMQASWNQDRSRHDRSSFNTAVGSLAVVQDIARAALGLDSNAILEGATTQPGILLESEIEILSAGTVYLVAREA